MPYECPNAGDPYTLDELVKKLETDPEFADFYARVLLRADAGIKEAKECVESYLCPSEDELIKFGYPSADWAGLRQCTDVGLFVLVTAKKQAPGVFLKKSSSSEA